MKRVLIYLFVSIVIAGCSFGSSQFVSEEYGFKVEFPCNYKNVGEEYGCEGENFYSVLFDKSPKTNLAEEKKEFEKRCEEKNKNKEPKEICHLTEKKINGYDSLEYFTIDKYDDKVLSASKTIYISKGDLLIRITGNSKIKDGNKPPEEFENFFNSIELK